MESKLAGFRAFYKKFEDIVSEIMIGICVAIFAVMVFSVSYGVLGRYLTFVKAARWTQELAILCLVWLCFVTAGYAIKEDRHVRMTIINRIVPEKAAKALHAFTYILLVLVNLFFIIYGWKLSVLSAKAKMSATGWPLNLYYISLIFGGVYGFLMSVGRLIKGEF